jgi:phage-related minor tail protein
MTKLSAFDNQINASNGMVQEMAKLMEGYEKTFVAHGQMLADLTKKVEVLTSENSALKAQAALRTRIASSIPMPGR